MNLTDFIQSDNSDLILVKGIGKMRLSQAKKRVQQMLNDLSNRVDNLVLEPGHDQNQWQTIDTLLKRGVLQAYIDAIVEARKKHEKNRKFASKSLSQGGFASVSSMEDDDLGMRIASGIEASLNISGKALAKFKTRQKSLNKSRNTHLAKLQSARNKMVARSRS